MGFNPNVPLVAVGDLITAAHINNIRANLDRLDTTKLTLTGGRMSGAILMGAVNHTVGEAATLDVTGRFSNASHTVNAPNAVLIRRGSTGTAGDVNQPIVLFQRSASTTTPTDTTIGSITIGASVTSVAYLTTSDERLKHYDDDVTDAAERVAALAVGVYRGRWLDDTGQPSGDAWDLVNAHDVAAVAPYAVTGERGAVDAAGNIDPQQVNYAALVPLLVAALGDAFERIEALEAAAA